jgi:hypothetical protein
MKYSTTPPTKEGWYWAKIGNRNVIVEICHWTGGTLKIFYCDASFPLNDPFLFEAFAGPIPEPEE